MAHVEAAGPADPEFHLVRHEAKAGPVRRARHGPAGELRLELGEASVEVTRVGHRLALERGPRAELTAAGAGREVRVGLRVGHLLHAALHANLAVEALPVEAHRGERPREQVPGLPAAAVRV